MLLYLCFSLIYSQAPERIKPAGEMRQKHDERRMNFSCHHVNVDSKYKIFPITTVIQRRKTTLIITC